MTIDFSDIIVIDDLDNSSFSGMGELKTYLERIQDKKRRNKTWKVILCSRKRKWGYCWRKMRRKVVCFFKIGKLTKSMLMGLN